MAMSAPEFPAFRPLPQSNAWAQCEECRQFVSYDTLDVLLAADRHCLCGGSLNFFWTLNLRPIKHDIRR